MPQILFLPLKFLSDLSVTLILWGYFLIAGIFALFFYSAVLLFFKDKESSFQLISSCFYKGFFKLADMIVPGLAIRIDPEIKKIKSSVIVCNHISYLDPIFLISLIKKQKTIIKGTFFKVPVFGWVVQNSGYIPFFGADIFNVKNSEMILNLKEYIKSGGNIFIFPEGTRSKDGSLGKFKKGAFSIAKILDAPLAAVNIKNTGKLFVPGKFLFNTMVDNEISVEVIKVFHPDYSSQDFSASKLSEEVWSLFAGRN